MPTTTFLMSRGTLTQSDDLPRPKSGSQEPPHEPPVFPLVQESAPKPPGRTILNLEMDSDTPPQAHQNSNASRPSAEDDPVEFCEISSLNRRFGLRRSMAFALLKAGRIRGVLVGGGENTRARKRLVNVQAVRDFLEREMVQQEAKSNPPGIRAGDQP